MFDPNPLMCVVSIVLCAAACGQPECPPGAVPEAGSCVADEAPPAMFAGDAGVRQLPRLEEQAVRNDEGFPEGCREPKDEACDGTDNDCDGKVDEGTAKVGFADRDGDGFGDATTRVLACPLPVGFVSDAGDCNDDCVDCFPGHEETCDGFDNDCDDEVDGALALDARDFFRDADGDSHGDPSTTLRACHAPEGYVTLGDDCRDDVAGAHPGAPFAGAPLPGDAEDWDWDCDGRVTLEVDHVTTACEDPTFLRCASSGWTSVVPACGQTTSLRECSGFTMCNERVVTATQRCR